MFLKKSSVYFLKPTGQKLNSNFNHSCSRGRSGGSLTALQHLWRTTGNIDKYLIVEQLKRHTFKKINLSNKNLKEEIRRAFFVIFVPSNKNSNYVFRRENEKD